MSGPVQPPHPGNQPHWQGGSVPPGSYPQQPFPQPGPPPPWGQPGPPPGPPRGGNRLLLALAFLAVIAVSVAATVWFTHRGSGDQGSGSGVSSSSSGGVASAGDIGPVGIITEDPTCDRWLSISANVYSQLEAWNKRDFAAPASAWTPEQRQTYESAARLFKAEADQVIELARQTPHRVVRELYEQLMAYNRAYADAIASYSPADDDLARVSNGAKMALDNVCAAIKNLSASKRADSVPPAIPPVSIAPVGDPSIPKRFMTTPSQACPEVRKRADAQNVELADWKNGGGDDAAQRDIAEKVLWDTAAKVLASAADEFAHLAQTEVDPVTSDFLVLTSQYNRAFVEAMPTSTEADTALYQAALGSQIVLYRACSSAQG